MATPILSVKQCPKCNTKKPTDHFYKNKRDGLSPYCKPCSAEYKRKGDLSRAEISSKVYPSTSTKVCSKCHSEKPLSAFNIRKRDGKEYPKSYCRSCQSEQFKAWAISNGKQLHDSREDLLAAIRNARYPEPDKKLCSGCGQVKGRDRFGSRFASGGLCKECRSSQESDLYARTKESRREYFQRYRQENLALVRKWAVDGQRRRAGRLKEAQAKAMATEDERVELIERYGLECMCCGTSERVTFDHIIPIVKGGDDGVDNLQLLCGPCNSSKATKTIDYRPKHK